MSTIEKKIFVTPQAYLEYDDSIDGKSEYYDGEIFDMAGGYENHSLISANFAREVGNAIEGSGCRVYDSNFKIELQENGPYVYPDFFVICGPTEKSTLRKDICKNPMLVVEVLSESTRAIDQGVKRFRYKMLPSLREYITVEQNHPLVFVQWLNDAGEWVETAYGSLDDIVELKSLGVSVPMKKIYANADFRDQ